MKEVLSKCDYEEPCCPLNMHPEVVSIPIGRIIEKLDSYLNQNDYAAAERHLRYWISEANACNDMRGKLTLLNEQIGLYRKIENETECLTAIVEALTLADSMKMEQSVTYGTTLINAATGYKAFGKTEEALPLYRKAQIIYESALDSDDGRLGGLYNNMALTLTELKKYREAEELFNKAIEVMEKQENGELEIAITHLNLADLAVAEYGLENSEKEIEKQLSEAERLLNTEGLPKDGYYAFVCEKCAPVFGYYGYFLTEQELNRRAREIYERT
ncbi:MAG: tetratricopeptide repeat protein [Clostridia bacterium]|nr:tetratricopeptide repeat protein [Clostridia bacterium]